MGNPTSRVDSLRSLVTSSVQYVGDLKNTIGSKFKGLIEKINRCLGNIFSQMREWIENKIPGLHKRNITVLPKGLDTNGLSLQEPLMNTQPSSGPNSPFSAATKTDKKTYEDDIFQDMPQPIEPANAQTTKPSAQGAVGNPPPAIAQSVVLDVEKPNEERIQSANLLPSFIIKNTPLFMIFLKWFPHEFAECYKQNASKGNNEAFKIEFNENITLLFPQVLDSFKNKKQLPIKSIIIEKQHQEGYEMFEVKLKDLKNCISTFAIVKNYEDKLEIEIPEIEIKGSNYKIVLTITNHNNEKNKFSLNMDLNLLETNKPEINGESDSRVCGRFGKVKARAHSAINGARNGVMRRFLPQMPMLIDLSEGSETKKNLEKWCEAVQWADVKKLSFFLSPLFAQSELDAPRSAASPPEESVRRDRMRLEEVAFYQLSQLRLL